MGDHGLLFSVPDDFGAKARAPLADVALLIDLLNLQPDSRVGSVEAARTLRLALDRADEVRHWNISDEAAGAIVWAIHDAWNDGPIPDGLVELRHILIDYLQRKDAA